MISSGTNILKVWEDGSVFKVLALQAPRYEFGSLSARVKTGMMVHMSITPTLWGERE